MALAITLTAFGVLVGMVVAIIAVFSIIQGKKSMSWPMVEGSILKSECYETSPATDEAGGYHISISYTYTIGGVSYTSDRVALRQSALVFFTRGPPAGWFQSTPGVHGYQSTMTRRNPHHRYLSQESQLTFSPSWRLAYCA